MYQKIIDDIFKLAEPDFANWVKPFLSIDDNSDDIVLGVRVPYLRKLAKTYKNIEENTLLELLTSKYHEARALALFIMVLRVKKEPQRMCEIYLQNLKHINNWDLIDYTAPHIVASIADETTIINLANSDYMWANRVAMVSTIYFIKQKDFRLALKFAEQYITHPHHLMHKASGWMLREVGKQDIEVLKSFLDRHPKMPSVMRNYAREILRKKQ